MNKEAALAAAPPSEAQWVEAELVRSLMRTQRNTQWTGLLLVPIMIGVLWGDTEPLALVGWALLAVAVSASRFWMLHRYAREVQGRGSAEHIAFFRRYRGSWVLPGLVWGLTPALHFDYAPLADQFICWMMLAGIAMYATNALSSQLETMRGYLNTVTTIALAVMAWHMVVDLHLMGPTYHWWLVAMVLIFRQVLGHAGEELHETHKINFSLQFRNNQLIGSLTRQTQAALDAVEIKNRFLASAAHDIRQPVHALGLYADWLSNEPELVHELAPKIVESTKAVNQLFDSLFDLSRLDAGKIRLNIETVHVGKLLRDLELQYGPLCASKGLDLRLHVVPGSTVSDPILLQRIVGNLIANAVKYTRQGGVLVASRQTREGLRVEVWDTGVGIAPEYQREIFREFYKVPTHAGTEDGFGLGLYIVGRLTHILGHTLTMASRPGRGSVFRLLLVPTDPQAAAERAATAERNAAPPTQLAPPKPATPSRQLAPRRS